MTTQTTIPGRDIVTEAVTALRTWSDDLTRDNADQLLSMWSDRRLLSSDQWRQVLDIVAPEREPVAGMDFLPGGVR